MQTNDFGGAENQDNHVSITKKQLHPSDFHLPKNKSTSNLLAHNNRLGINIPRTRARYSLDVDSAIEEGESFGK